MESPSPRPSALHARRASQLGGVGHHARHLSIAVSFNWRRVLATPGDQRTLGELDELRTFMRDLRCRFFDKLSDETLRGLGRAVTCLSLPAGAFVYRQGEPGNVFYVCLRGQVCFLSFCSVDIALILPLLSVTWMLESARTHAPLAQVAIFRDASGAAVEEPHAHDDEHKCALCCSRVC